MFSEKQWNRVAENRRPRGREPVPVGEIVSRIREGAWFREPGNREALERVLADVLGPDAGWHACPGGVRGGRLLIFVDDPAYGFALRNFHYSRILKAVQDGVPKLGVRELQFKLDARAGSRGNGRVPQVSRGNAEA